LTIAVGPRRTSKTNLAGQPVSYEIIPESVDPSDGTYSTGDLWTVIKKSFGAEMGAEVGNTDSERQGMGVGSCDEYNAMFARHR
jgi:hypothetical protein